MVQSENLKRFAGSCFSPSYRLFTKQIYELQLFHMSAKKRRGAKVLQHEPQKGSSVDVDSPDLSAIERASFLEGLQAHDGNPLHSTALEEDLNVLEDGRMNKGKAGGKDIPQTLKTTGKQRGAAVKRKETERDEEEEEEKKRSRKSSGGKVKARPENQGETKKKSGASAGERAELHVERKESDPSAKQPAPTAGKLKKLVGKKPAKVRRAGQTSAARPVKNQPMKKGKKKESESGSANSRDAQSVEESDTDTAEQRRKRVLSSDQEAVDEDASLSPSPKKARLNSLVRTRKSSSDRTKTRTSSSGSASAESEKANKDKKMRKRLGGQGATEFDVVLDAFLDFCEQYRESVESKAVKQSIDSFSSNVKEQLLEKISSHKALKALKRENAKVGSLIRKKRQRLLDAKHELMRAERQMWLLQKEKTELKLRLSDLRRGQAFLHDFRELNRQYLDYRHKHPKEKETYGASSLPVLLLEAKHIQTAEHQLRRINNRLENRLKKSGK
ncbi:uncharacterized protein cenpu [Symphorus nematophorus]